MVPPYLMALLMGGGGFFNSSVVNSADKTSVLKLPALAGGGRPPIMEVGGAVRIGRPLNCNFFFPLRMQKRKLLNSPISTVSVDGGSASGEPSLPAEHNDY